MSFNVKDAVSSVMRGYDEDGALLEKLRAGGYDANGRDGERSYVCAAALEGKLELVLALLGANADPSGECCGRFDDEGQGCATGRPYYTPLADAARKGHVSIVSALAAAGAPLDEIDYRNETALIKAAGGWAAQQLASKRPSKKSRRRRTAS